MDLPPPVNNSAFMKLQHTVLKAGTDEAEASMQSTVYREIELSIEVEKTMTKTMFKMQK